MNPIQAGLVAALLAVAVIFCARYFGPKPIPVAATITVGTGGPFRGITCCAEGTCWNARKNGMCFLADKRQFNSQGSGSLFAGGIGSSASGIGANSRCFIGPSQEPKLKSRNDRQDGGKPSQNLGVVCHRPGSGIGIAYGWGVLCGLILCCLIVANAGKSGQQNERKEDESR